MTILSQPDLRKVGQRDSSCTDPKNFSVNSLLTKSGRARQSFKAVLRLSSLSALRSSLLAIVLADGGVFLPRFVGPEERVGAVDVLAKESVGARVKGRGVCEV